MDNNNTNIFESNLILRDGYTQLLLKAFKDGLEAVKSAKEQSTYIGKYHNFPNLSYKENGLPNFSTSFGGGPTDYRDCFNSFGGKPPLINGDNLESFKELVSFVRSHNSLKTRFDLELNKNATNELNIEIDQIIVISGIKDCIEKYIHNFNSFEFDEVKAKETISHTISYIFDEQLNIDICIPILFLNFQFDQFQLARNVYIERIPDSQHLARYNVKSYNTSTHEQVISSATHALVLKDWLVPNPERIWGFDILTNSRAYPLDLINQFFGALRICLTVDTGYAQIYALAKGWHAHSKANLPHVQGVSIRSYPTKFEDYYWNIENVPTVNSDTANQIKELFNQIKSAKQNSINLSLKRLNSCLVRDEEEDAVLDATIALEALLSDNSTQEMTHKLAMRVGALSNLDCSHERTPQESFQDIKKIYGYRSAIVHGSKDLSKKRIIKIDEQKNTSAHLLAIDYLKMILKVLLKHEKYRQPETIDSELLLGEAMDKNVVN